VTDEDGCDVTAAWWRRRAGRDETMCRAGRRPRDGPSHGSFNTGRLKNCAAPYNATRGEALGCEDILSAYKIVGVDFFIYVCSLILFKILI
jgi:hypothetical protein